MLRCHGSVLFGLCVALAVLFCRGRGFWVFGVVCREGLECVVGVHVRRGGWFSRGRWSAGVAVGAALSVVASGVALAGLGLPVPNPSVVGNPSVTVSAGSVPMGGTPGSVSVGDSGVAGYEIPLRVVAGRGDFQPRLSLRYSSQAGNGQVGVGFSLTGLSQVSRCPRTVADDQVARGVQLDGTDLFCLNGQKLIAVSGVYGADGTEYRTLADTHVRVKSFRVAGTPASEVGPTSFRVWQPDGTVESFGDFGTRVQVRKAGSGVTVNTAWSIWRATDRSGNTMVFDYGVRRVSDANPSEIERWVERISYGRGDTLDRMVDFGYDTRPDKRLGYALGQPRESTKRLTSVTMSANVGGWKRARSYTLEYQNDGASKASKLHSVLECGVVASECKRPTVLSWTLGSEGFQSGVAQAPGVPSSTSSQVVAADFDGDGRTDLVWPESTGWKVVLASSSGYQTVKAFGPNSQGTGTKAWPVDYDGDGRMDLMPREKTVGAAWQPLVSNGDGSARKVRTGFQGGFNQDRDTSGAFPGDFNGDGYQDVVEYTKAVSGWTWTWRKHTGTVNSQVDSASDPFDDKAFGPAQSLVMTTVSPADVSVADVDGDGRDEVLLPQDESLVALDVAGSGGGVVRTGLPDGLRKVDKQWLDLNGDGLTDLVTNGTADGSTGPTLYYWLNTGAGFTGAKTTNMSSEGFAYAQVVDYEGDGRRDLLVPRPAGGGQLEPLWSRMDVIRTGVSSAGTLAFSKTATTVSFNAVSSDDLHKQGPRMIDANGDGLSDLLLVERPPLGTSGTPALKLFLHNTDGGSGGDSPDLLWRVYEGEQHPKGPVGSLPPSVEFTYAPLTDSTVYDQGSCPRTTGITCLHGGTSYVVKQVRRDAGVDDHTQMVSNYSYTDGRVDKFGRDSLGFKERKVVTFPEDDVSRQVVERSFFSNTERHKDPRLQERWVIHRLPNNRQRMDRTVNAWDVKGSGLLFFNYVSATEKTSYEFDTVSGLASMSRSEFGALNKIPFKTVTQDVSGMDVYGNAGKTVTHSVTKAGVLESKSTVTRTYDIDAGEWLVHRPQKVITQDEVFDPALKAFGPAKTRTRFTTYEGATDRVDVIRSYASDAKPGRELDTAFDYDVSGNVVRRTSTDKTSGKVREATYAYDGFGFPHATQNGLEQTSYTFFDPLLGALKVAVDVNGLRTDYTFDSLGRPVKTKLPTGAETTTGYSLEEVGGEYLIRAEVKDGTGAVMQSVVDRLGRPVIDRFKGFNAAMRERTRSYNTLGDLASQSTFHPAGTLAGQVEKTTYTYDDLGRIRSQREPDTDKPRTWEYDGLTTAYTDTRGGVSTSVVDADGLLTSQTDGKGAASNQTTFRVYTHGPFGQLTGTQVTGKDGSASVYDYDDQGALTSSTDGERGTTTNGYNAFGELTTRTGEDGRKTAVDYDVLGRETTRTVTKAGTTRSTLTRTWDSVAGRTRKGALMQVAFDDRTNGVASTTTDYFYDGFSRLDQVSENLPTTMSPTAPRETISADYDYDTFSRLTAVRYPKLKGQAEGTQVTYSYGPAATTNGRLASVQTGTETLWTAKDTDGQDRLVKEEAGDGTTTSQSLDWNGQVQDLKVATSSDDIHPSTTLFQEDYTYDDEGNLGTRSQGAVTEKFTYDPLNRLATAKTYNPTTGAVYQSDDWNYDTLGNLTSSELRGTYTYGDPTRPTQVTKVTGGLFGIRDYTYDPVGNQTGRPGATLTYNDFNLPNKITATGGGSTSFLYDGNSERVRKTGPQGTITYLPGLYERHQTVGGTEHRLLVQAGGRNVATLHYQETTGATSVTKQPTLYTHTDRLGSTRLLTQNKNAATDGPFQAVVAEQRSYDALGKPRNPDLTRGDDQYTTGIQPRALHQGYTAQDEDDEYGLVNMHARIYDPTLGRFTTPDTIINGANPTQAYNRYTYVSNNPLRYTDPTGHGTCSAGSHCTEIPECIPNDDGGCSGTSTEPGGTTNSDGESSNGGSEQEPDNWVEEGSGNGTD
ncbi:FG-GAP-like repeat-containing protein, partial [Streptomyces sp. NPDC056661]|uniref:FG-GAP-like repeat-containing protein n=1 Tax=Streptomyces sp. NPDC056661 TaxID=3345898 RepID=UPI0036A76A16